MNEKQKQELLTIINEYGIVLHRGHDLAARIMFQEIQRRVMEVPDSAEKAKE